MNNVSGHRIAKMVSLLGIMALMFVLLAAVSGCGGQRQGNDRATPPVAAEQAKPPAAAEQAKPEQSKLKLSWSVPGLAPTAVVFIAKEKGFFNKYGLDVELTQIASAPMAAAALIAGEVDIAEGGGPGIVSAVLEGADLKIIGSMASYTMAAVLAKPEIKNHQELKGKKVGITKVGSTSWFVIRTAARGWGMDPDKDFTLLQTGGIGEIVAALQSGAIDAGVLFENSIPRLKDMGYNELINLYDVPSMQSATATTGAFLQRNPVAVANFLKAYLEAVKFFRENKEESLRIAAALMKVDAQGMPYLEGAYDTIVAGEKVIAKVPYPETKSIQTILDELPQEKAGKAKPDQFIDAGILKQLVDSGFVAQLYRK